MPVPPLDSMQFNVNRLIEEELQYDREALAEEQESLFQNLTEEHRKVYDEVMEAIDKRVGGIFFVYGYGGTGKTFVWRTLSAAIRSKGEIVLNVASSGIASLLLPGGQTAHSRFAIPFSLNEDSTCNINRAVQLHNLL
ncbi:unnamed protein product [Cuscuta europaea]|uniref:ATP-dependent DNA helicase n=1 Tax=Cuscuta europaea TaxID=41803 RepID=A0A9P1E1Q0_CUSEU|nr:unnamed protein product [Cuscuta europaea]